MAILGTKTSSDINASADINSLSSRALDKEGTAQLDALQEGVLQTGDWVLGEKGGSTQELVKFPDTEFSKPDFIIDIPAGMLYYPTGALAPAPYNPDTGSNVEDFPRLLCDASTDEGGEWFFRIPPDANTSGTITIEWTGSSDAASPSGTVVMSVKFAVAPVNGTTTWDQSYGTPLVSSAVTMDTQDRLELFSITGAFSTVFGGVNRWVALQSFRDVSEDTMSTDFSWAHLRIKIPRT